MTELLTAAQMRAIEQAAIESGEVTGLELMERAGRGVVEAIFEEWPELAKTSHRAVVLCGPGNNGGDGFVVARLLKEWGWEVEVFLYGDEGKLPADAKVNCERWRKMGEVTPLTEKAFRNKFSMQRRSYADVYIDALFGTGLKRALDDDALNVISHMAGRNGDDYGSRTVAIDAPSGLCLDSGHVLESEIQEVPGLDRTFEVVKAYGLENRLKSRTGRKPFQDRFVAMTVVFDSPKVGHFIADGPACSGKIYIKDIGLRIFREMDVREGYTRGPMKPMHTTLLCDKPLLEDNRTFGPKPFIYNKFKKHKYAYGHAYILSGPASKTGAARLAARGALRTGAGMVTVACPPDAVVEHAAQLNAIMLNPVADGQALSAVLADERINAICVGPALGLDQDRADVLAAVLKAKRATVVDADALTLLAQNPELVALLHDKCVLTPHGGEFARVFPDIAEKLAAPATKGPAYSKVDATREAAKRAGCVVLFKGADTVIADTQGRCAINSAHYARAAPWLATAGSGDVLAGFITGLLARGFDPMQAAEVGAWLHVECALKFGPGLIAEDIPEQLPGVFSDLGL